MWSMTRSAADFEIPNSGPSCRMVRFVRQYAATSSTRSSSGSPHGRPWGRRTTAPAPHETYQLAELPLVQACEQSHPARL